MRIRDKGGRIIEVHDSYGRRMLEMGRARLVKQEAPPPPAEKARKKPAKVAEDEPERKD